MFDIGFQKNYFICETVSHEVYIMVLKDKYKFISKHFFSKHIFMLQSLKGRNKWFGFITTGPL